VIVLSGAPWPTLTVFMLAAGGATFLWTFVLWQAVAAGLVLLMLGLGLVWLSKYAPAQYLLTHERVESREGLIARSIRVMPVVNMQHVLVRQTWFERVTGTGTVLLASAGTGTYAMIWRTVRDPNAWAAKVRTYAAEAAALGRREVPLAEPDEQSGSLSMRSTGGPSSVRPPEPLVLGLVGGIGAGKSEVARILGTMGYLVVDADKDAKAALDLPQVRDQLVQWWGMGILAADGSVDRKQVAAIVFGNPDDRRQLESLVHPIVRADRSSVVQRARREGKAGVVIDAPLLFEAGSDKECDAVLCVDAPRKLRVERVKKRGWSEDDLAAREAAQIPIDEKKRRSHGVIMNDSDMVTLRRRVEEVCDKLRRKLRPQG
jgi:dephospho-CoA kinase